MWTRDSRSSVLRGASRQWKQRIIDKSTHKKTACGSGPSKIGFLKSSTYPAPRNVRSKREPTTRLSDLKSVISDFKFKRKSSSTHLVHASHLNSSARALAARRSELFAHAKGVLSLAIVALQDSQLMIAMLFPESYGCLIACCGF